MISTAEPRTSLSAGSVRDRSTIEHLDWNNEIDIHYKDQNRNTYNRENQLVNSTDFYSPYRHLLNVSEYLET